MEPGKKEDLHHLYRRVVIDLTARREAVAPATYTVQVLTVSLGTRLISSRPGCLIFALPTGERVEIRIMPSTCDLYDAARELYKELGKPLPDYLK